MNPTFTLTYNVANNTWQWQDATGSAVGSGAANGSGQAGFACTGTYTSFSVSADSGSSISGTASPYTATLAATAASSIISGTVNSTTTVKFTLQKPTGGY